MLKGLKIPVDAVQDMEIRLKDISGRTILLRERVGNFRQGQPTYPVLWPLVTVWLVVSVEVSKP